MLDHLELAQACFQELDDEIGLGVCNLALGVVARLSGSPDDALRLFEQVRD